MGSRRVDRRAQTNIRFDQNPNTHREIRWDSNCDLVLQFSFHGRYICPDAVHLASACMLAPRPLARTGRDRQCAKLAFDNRAFGLTTVVPCSPGRVLHVGDHEVGRGSTKFDTFNKLCPGPYQIYPFPRSRSDRTRSMIKSRADRTPQCRACACRSRTSTLPPCVLRAQDRGGGVHTERGVCACVCASCQQRHTRNRPTPGLRRFHRACLHRTEHCLGSTGQTTVTTGCL